MSTEDIKRKLTAIFSADVEGYSRLMEGDELATVQTLTSYKETMRKQIKHYRGRVVDSTGDNLLAEFPSVVDAVQCAVEVQQIIKGKNEDLPENRRMLFRIGINLGDVLEEGDRIFGDGVNIAARIESMADGGGICISGTAYDHIKNKLALAYNYLGEHSVKNISEPVRVYKVPMDPKDVGKRRAAKPWKKAAIAAAVILILGVGALTIWHFHFRPPPIEAASVEKMAFKLPQKPSIAVLPFENLSDDPSQENIVDGITDAIITGLSKTPEMFVIARNSVFTYKGKPVKVKQVSEELGVRYVLEGSVQKQGDRLRINAQLIDAIKGHHLWAEKYDLDLKDLFALQDEITMKIITELQVKLTEGEYGRVLAKGTKNLKAYLKCLQAIRIHRRSTKEDNLKSRKMFEEVIALDPNYPRPYIYLGWTHLLDVQRGWSKSPKEDLARAEELAKKALELDDSLGLPLRLLADIHMTKKQWDKALAEAELAVSKDPNEQNMYGLAYTLWVVGRHEESIAWFKKAFRLDPSPPALYIRMLGIAYFNAERYEEALTEYKRALRKGGFNPKRLHLGLAAIYAMLGQEEKARHHVAEVLKIDPKDSLKRHAKIFRWFFKNRADADRWINALRKAGLPEEPPLRLPDKPSIAVLPFANISGDPKEDYLSDGITENIITALSKTPKMLVIARNSVFTYKGKPVMVQQVSEELGVRYVLEGSVQKEGDRLRITAQLIDAKTGNHIWSDRYDRELKDLFALQDEITMRVIEGLRVNLTEGEQGRIYSWGTDNLEAYLKVLKGLDLVLRFRSKEDNALGRQMYEEAIALDPGYSNAYALLAWTHNHDKRFGWTKTPKKSINLMLENAQKAVSLDESNANAHSALEWAYLFMGMPDKALAAGKQAIALAPNGADTNALHSYVLLALGRNEEALATINKAIHLNPITPMWVLAVQGHAYLHLGLYEEAIAAYKKALRLNPDYLAGHVALAVSYSLSGQEEKAHVEAKEILRLSPKFSVEQVKPILAAYKKDRKDIFVNALRKAGLK